MRKNKFRPIRPGDVEKVNARVISDARQVIDELGDEEVAARLGVSRSLVNMIKKGSKKLTPNFALRVVKVWRPSD